MTAQEAWEPADTDRWDKIAHGLYLPVDALKYLEPTWGGVVGSSPGSPTRRSEPILSSHRPGPVRAGSLFHADVSWCERLDVYSPSSMFKPMWKLYGCEEEWQMSTIDPLQLTAADLSNPVPFRIRDITAPSA